MEGGARAKRPTEKGEERGADNFYEKPKEMGGNLCHSKPLSSPSSFRCKRSFLRPYLSSFPSSPQILLQTFNPPTCTRPSLPLRKARIGEREKGRRGEQCLSKLKGIFTEHSLLQDPPSLPPRETREREMALRTTTTRAERRRRGQHFEKKGERRVSSSSFNPRPLFFP